MKITSKTKVGELVRTFVLKEDGKELEIVSRQTRGVTTLTQELELESDFRKFLFRIQFQKKINDLFGLILDGWPHVEL